MVSQLQLSDTFQKLTSKTPKKKEVKVEETLNQPTGMPSSILLETPKMEDLSESCIQEIPDAIEDTTTTLATDITFDQIIRPSKGYDLDIIDDPDFNPFESSSITQNTSPAAAPHIELYIPPIEELTKKVRNYYLTKIMYDACLANILFS